MLSWQFGTVILVMIPNHEMTRGGIIFKLWLKLILGIAIIYA